jgi:hypothetical protein
VEDRRGSARQQRLLRSAQLAEREARRREAEILAQRRDEGLREARRRRRQRGARPQALALLEAAREAERALDGRDRQLRARVDHDRHDGLDQQRLHALATHGHVDGEAAHEQQRRECDSQRAPHAALAGSIALPTRITTRCAPSPLARARARR